MTFYRVEWIKRLLGRLLAFVEEFKETDQPGQPQPESQNDWANRKTFYKKKRRKERKLDD
jgi:hypothetical protein